MPGNRTVVAMSTVISPTASMVMVNTVSVPRSTNCSGGTKLSVPRCTASLVVVLPSTVNRQSSRTDSGSFGTPCSITPTTPGTPASRSSGAFAVPVSGLAPRAGVTGREPSAGFGTSSLTTRPFRLSTGPGGSPSSFFTGIRAPGSGGPGSSTEIAGMA